MLNLPRLRPALRAAWGPDTCDPNDLPNWHPGNPSRGQCGTTALVVHDLLGGELILGEVHEDEARVGFHYWNRLPDGTEVDLTRDQFLPGETVTGGRIVARPADAPRRCRGQYELLRHRVLARVDSFVPQEPRPLTPLAAVLLRDPTGAILLQLRAADAAAEPGQWSLPGGHVEAGEDPRTAARRELAEETGLAVDGDLDLCWHGLRPDASRTGAGARSSGTSTPARSQRPRPKRSRSGRVRRSPSCRYRTSSTGTSAPRPPPFSGACCYPKERRRCLNPPRAEQ